MAKEVIKFPPDAIFNDFLYTILYNASAEKKRLLKGKYLKAAMSETSAKTFIQNASLEDKLYMMCELGQKFFMVLVNEKTTPTEFKGILDLFEKDQKSTAYTDILRNGLFVSSDSSFNRFLGFVSRSIHHHSFFLSMEQVRAGFHVRKWAKRAYTQRDLAFREADESTTELVKLLLHGSIASDYVKSAIGINPTELKLLLYFYTHPHTFVSEKHLYDYFKGCIRESDTRLGVRALWKSGFLEMDKLPEKRYTITGTGTQKVAEYLRFVFAKINQ